ncbi:MAG: phosphoribosylglycinamide formyltransferase [Cytophagales bacterium]|nr:phosphoribosylglycinamide formyltransferase [Cytophagales bacterium]
MRKKIGIRSKVRLCLLASGTGSNAQNISESFKDHPRIEVGALLSNSKTAPVLEKIRKMGIEVRYFPNTSFEENSEPILKFFRSRQIDLIVLAGFLRCLSRDIVRAFDKKILNLHPSLLPKYGGKGMYGNRVHQAVLDAGEPETGITIHHVNEDYDQGDVMFTHSCPVDKKDTVETLAQKIRHLEHEKYPQAIKVIAPKFSHYLSPRFSWIEARKR